MAEQLERSAKLGARPSAIARPTRATDASRLREERTTLTPTSLNERVPPDLMELPSASAGEGSGEQGLERA